ncbi:uncharacterized protein H6S33_004223 [Morchella sextelata]|uniref:uncharacterized protein n=1 Tax=Morchella sextelata TaxID=1174677 RepID=UPI001D04CB79|nr:uncharacterized protein H6S33_004223 [Morchella sextelata]KAH0605766.1 hypothetical protein H6S33_004223 [Morchella sextelata]
MTKPHQKRRDLAESGHSLVGCCRQQVSPYLKTSIDLTISIYHNAIGQRETANQPQQRFGTRKKGRRLWQYVPPFVCSKHHSAEQGERYCTLVQSMDSRIFPRSSPSIHYCLAKLERGLLFSKSNIDLWMRIDLMNFDTLHRIQRSPHNSRHTHLSLATSPQFYQSNIHLRHSKNLLLHKNHRYPGPCPLNLHPLPELDLARLLQETPSLREKGSPFINTCLKLTLTLGVLHTVPVAELEVKFKMVHVVNLHVEFIPQLAYRRFYQ